MLAWLTLVASAAPPPKVVPGSNFTTTPGSCTGHGAVGTAKNGSLACFCFPLWRGEHCEIPTCGPCVYGDCVSAAEGKHAVTCKCRPGYGGPACDVKVCPGDCSGHGECKAGVCSCDYLWTGDACDQRACPNNCSQHGSCVRNVCECDEGWESFDCHMASCPAGCAGHGDCVGGKCQCYPGWSGPACTSPGCEGDCGHGLCIGGSCVCQAAWTGANCDEFKASCTDEQCGWPKGHCGADGACVCEVGFFGPSCADVACLHNCSGHGLCTASGCECEPGWTGLDCSMPPCPVGKIDRARGKKSAFGAEASGVCSNHGKCSQGKCECFAGYAGDDCAQRQGCLAAHCSGHGDCVSTAGVAGAATDGPAGVCLCESGWTGAHCEAKSCEHGCSSHGRCEDGACLCYDGWDGPTCATKRCPGAPQPCSGHGYCGTDGVCECVDGYLGDDCSYSPGCPDDCLSGLGRGVCLGTPGRCKCAPGYEGPNCGLRKCPRDCSGHGTCDGATGVCLCEVGYEDRADCAVDHAACFPACKHGACVAGVCECNPGFRGAACADLLCGPDQFGVGELGSCGSHGACVGGVCQCATGFEPSAAGLVCERVCPADCHPPFGFCGANGACVCVAGRGGEDCTAVFCEDDCNGAGRCDAEGKCHCFAGHSGPTCAQQSCDTNCSGHGACYDRPRPESIAPPSPTPLPAFTDAKNGRAAVAAALSMSSLLAQSPAEAAPAARVDAAALYLDETKAAVSLSGVCICETGWMGAECDVRACPCNCKGNGLCLPDGKCKCFPGYRGADCGTAMCKGSPLVGGRECGGPAHGTCGQDGACHCKPGWGGEACERPTCPGGAEGVCSGRGLCGVGPAGAACNCSAPFSGPACEEATCPNDCSGRGVCTQPPDLLAGRCVCDAGWYGPDCGYAACPRNCSNAGFCTLGGTCVCMAGRTGEACEESGCPGGSSVHVPPAGPGRAETLAVPDDELGTLLGARSQGCGGRGECDTATRTCACDDGFSGPDCGHVPCPGNCNGRGTCGGVTPGVCACEPFYFGEACEKVADCASGCNGRGNCTDGGVCECEPGWAGADCEHRSCAPHAADDAVGRCIDGGYECRTPFEAVATPRAPGEAAVETSLCRSSAACMHGCNGHGTCDAEIGACACQPGWRGEWCQWADCSPGCGAHGWCDNGFCACDAGFTGSTCALRACLNDCSGHGLCVQPAEGEGVFGACRCDNGWCGIDCSTPVPDYMGPPAAASPPSPPAGPMVPPPFALPSAGGGGGGSTLKPPQMEVRIRAPSQNTGQR